jgi:hypothetical protein
MMMRIFVFFFSITLLSFSVSCNGYAFRCGYEPIGRWDSKEKVLKHCGQPSKRGYEKVYHKGTYIHAETWYYNCGATDFVYAVSFHDNISRL